jgi:hypothetical protein
LPPPGAPLSLCLLRQPSFADWTMRVQPTTSTPNYAGSGAQVSDSHLSTTIFFPRRPLRILYPPGTLMSNYRSQSLSSAPSFRPFVTEKLYPENPTTDVSYTERLPSPTKPIPMRPIAGTHVPMYSPHGGPSDSDSHRRNLQRNLQPKLTAYGTLIPMCLHTKPFSLT